MSKLQLVAGVAVRFARGVGRRAHTRGGDHRRPPDLLGGRKAAAGVELFCATVAGGHIELDARETARSGPALARRHELAAQRAATLIGGDIERDELGPLALGEQQRVAVGLH
jgi:hypothetical protein